MRGHRLPTALLILLLASAPSLAGDEGEPPPPAPVPEEEAAPEPALVHPVWETMGEALVEFRGGVEAGLRFVSGDDGGRYEQDVHLDDGLRLLAADLEGTALKDGLLIDSLSFHARGVGDPDRRLDLRVRRDDVYDFEVHADRLETLFSAAGELNPHETVRRREGGSLRFRPVERLLVSLSTDHVRREGDATLSMMYRDDQPFPTPTVLDYGGRFHSVGLDATPGVFRVGGTWSWSRASDDSWRVLDRPDTPERDTGVYRNRSDVHHDALAGRLGARLFRGRLDLSADGGYTTGGTDSRLRDDAVVSTPGSDGMDGTPDDEAWSHASRGSSSADLRGHRWRGRVLWRPRDDAEVQGWYEARSTDERGSLHLRTEDEPVGVDFGPPVRMEEHSRAGARLQRTGAEVRWRASREWRLRGGWERVRERVHTEEPAQFEEGTWSPVTRIGTAGADWAPSSRFDAGLLVRAADASGAATQLSADDARSLSLRVRARRPDGFHLTGWLKVKDRKDGAANSDSSVDSYGFLFGGADADGFFEISADRRDYTVRSDTRYVVNLVPGAVKGRHRVRYDEDVWSASTTLSHRVQGPLRAFGTVTGARATGDYDWIQYDASLGVGWRLSPSTELRLEARRVCFNEGGRLTDDYRTEILTASVLWEW